MLILVAFVAGVSLSVAGLMALLVVKATEVMDVSIKQKIEAEQAAADLRKEGARVNAAIEANSLPWIPKTDKLEARYENEAIDKMENPSFYQDVVEGLGGVR